MRYSPFITLAGALALAACGGSEEAPEGQSEEEIAAEMAEVEKPLPGQYEAKAQLLEFSVPGVPEGMIDQMREVAAGEIEKGHSFCLTEAEVEDGWRSFSEKMADGDCSFNRFEVNGSNLDAEMACKIGVEGQMTEGVVQLQGQTGADTQSMTMTMNQNLPVGSVRMRMQMDTQRTGDCTPS